MHTYAKCIALQSECVYVMHRRFIPECEKNSKRSVFTLRIKMAIIKKLDNGKSGKFAGCEKRNCSSLQTASRIMADCVATQVFVVQYSPYSRLCKDSFCVCPQNETSDIEPLLTIISRVN